MTATRISLGFLALLATALLSMLITTSAQAALSLEHVGLGLNSPPPTNADGSPQLTTEDLYLKPPFLRQAGAHPDLTIEIDVPLKPNGSPVEALKDVDVDLPKGFVGNPTAVATCKPAELANTGGSGAACPTPSQVGVAEVHLRAASNQDERVKIGLFSISRGADVPALFGFNFSNVVGLISARVNPEDYSISSGSFSISQGEAVAGVRVTFWGVPADPSHDSLRSDGQTLFGGPLGGPTQAYLCGVGREDPGSCWGGGSLADPAPGSPCFNHRCGPVSTDASPKALLSMPTSCPEEPAAFTLRADSWENPGQFDTRVLTADEDGVPFKLEGCERLPFSPEVDVEPLSRAAASPTGLNVDLRVPQTQDPDGFSAAHLRDVKMTFPPGMSVSASSAAGLAACSPAEIGLGTNAVPACPGGSKLGSVEIDTPLLEETLSGSVFLAKQNDNPFNSLLALYIAVKGPGFYLKLPGKIEADPQTGQLSTSFTDNPQLPFEELRLKLAGGPQAPLTTPSSCGTYAVESELTPWSGTAPVKISSAFTVDQGCAAGGFEPKLQAGTVDPAAGSFSPFILRITRNDGEQNLARLSATLPEGLLAKLKGVELCGDAQAATGECPAASQVGKVVVGAGSGSNPLYVPEAGKAPTAAYLAGPYKGAPYSLVVKVPAQAGPFDLGTVTVRNALRIDPTTTQVTAVSDPLPQILQGIPIAYRDVRVEVNRDQFTINPTSCKQQQVTSTLISDTGQTATPSSPFQAASCGELGFGPSLKLRFKGGTKRTANPAVTATLKAPPGQANIAKTTVILPKSEFIDNAHINNPCTRVQFNDGKCPASSILGTATAYTPLLDQPLVGPVYFRSNGGDRELPDLVADLNGKIRVTVVGFIDSVKTGKEGSRVRTRFLNVPDAPVSKFTIKLKGGKKGLIENSRNLCTFTPKAKVQMTGQNGKPHNFAAKIATSCGKKKRKK
jgi:hypothetical protein